MERLPDSIRELRPHITWDAIKEGAKLMLPFLAGVGIKEWVHVHETALMWTAAFIIAACIAFWGQRSPKKRKEDLQNPVLVQEAIPSLFLGLSAEDALSTKSAESDKWLIVNNHGDTLVHNVKIEPIVINGWRIEFDEIPYVAAHDKALVCPNISRLEPIGCSSKAFRKVLESSCDQYTYRIEVPFEMSCLGTSGQRAPVQPQVLECIALTGSCKFKLLHGSGEKLHASKVMPSPTTP